MGELPRFEASASCKCVKTLIYGSYWCGRMYVQMMNFRKAGGWLHYVQNMQKLSY
jgi:hypothetical protein